MSNILIVEDDRWLAEAYQLTLEGQGHKTIVCNNGYAAIEALDFFIAELVVLDLLLPGANGIQLLHEISSYQDLSKIKVIMLSNSFMNNRATYANLRSYGVKRMLEKSLTTPAILLKTVEEVLSEN